MLWCHIVGQFSAQCNMAEYLVVGFKVWPKVWCIYYMVE